MHPDVLNAHLEKEPFVPFRLHLSDGRTFDVRFPGLTYLSGTAYYVLEPAHPDRERARFVTNPNPKVIALRHIVSIEPITPAAA
jgi:hypothetical protein